MDNVRTRFLILSDTHNDPFGVRPPMPVDVAIHCGDLTEESKIEEFRSAIQLLKDVDAPLKLVIAGNHDFTLDEPLFRKKVAQASTRIDMDDVRREYGDFGESRALWTAAAAHNIRFLEEGTYHFNLANGASLTIYASPFTPSLSDWGFQFEPDQGHDFAIPLGVDVVVTHGPPKGILDVTDSGKRAGCPSLFGAVARARPRLHCFGHIHEAWGMKLVAWRDVISAHPSHFSDIDNGKSVVVDSLSHLRAGKYDSADILEQKEKKRMDHNREGYCKTEDVDVAAPPAAINDIWEGVSAGAPSFSFESDGKIAFDASQGFRIRVNIIELGGGCIDRVHTTEPLFEGTVASISDLLLLRAVTVVDRGGDGDIFDFRWLLAEVARQGNFPAINEEELAVLCQAGISCLGKLSLLVIAAVLGSANEAAAMRLLDF